jgi:hypothetical protein
MVAQVFRSCVECPKCHTRYIIGANPYRNGSFMSSYPSGDTDLRRLYCSCLRQIGRSSFKLSQLKTYTESQSSHFGFFPFKLSELKTYAVPEWANARGYGSPDEIVLFADATKRAG